MTLSRAEIESKLDRHLLGIVNMWRSGMNDQDVRLLSTYSGLPEWTILRVGRDLGVLTAAQQEHYDELITELDRLDET